MARMHDANLLEDQPIAWTPTPDLIERAQLTKFMRQIGVSTWDELYEFSIRDVERFTEEVLKFLDIKFDPPYTKLLDISEGVEFPTWLRSADAPSASGDYSTLADDGVRVPSAGLNITEMCLDRWQPSEPWNESTPAIIWEGEEGRIETYDYYELLEGVDSIASGLQACGFRKGDAIGMHLPMTPETVIILLAIGRIGAIAVPVFSGYGVSAVEARLEAVQAKALFTSVGFPRRGKQFDSLEIGEKAASNVKSIQKIFVVDRPGLLSTEEVKYMTALDVNSSKGTFEELHRLGVERLVNSRFEPTSAEDPLIILYTSGTTGKPKGIAHTHASFPIKAAQDMAFGTDVGRGTRICWYTDIGWMMGPWLIYGALINGATICLYDGAPDYPTPDRMWEFCAKHKVEILGIAPTLVRSLAAHDERNADAIVRSSESASPASETPSGKKGWHSRGYLPHFDGDVTQFVTFRLADSLPRSVIRQIELEAGKENASEAAKTKRLRLEEYLDSGAGECILSNPDIASLVQETILNEHENTCRLDAWVIMPNHVHLLLRPNKDISLSTIMKSIKSVSAHKINKLLGRSGPVWQPDYFDRYIRDAEHHAKAIRYIEKNPVKAGLCSDPSEWKFSSAATSENVSKETAADGEAGSSSRADDGVRVPIYERHDLSSLRSFASSGEPWNPGPWWWLFEKVGNSKIPIINYSGGTEISGGILMGNPLLPQKPCSFPAPCPGMDADIMDEEGNPVPPGKVGELVLRQPWIGMARGFWHERERYLETYWNRFPGIWVHGDWAMRDEDGHWFILGRSDDTLKVAGKRVGPAEVESLLVAHPLVTEAAVIGVPDEVKGTAMVAFCVLNDEGRMMNDESTESENSSIIIHHSSLADELRSLVAKDMGKPLAPSKIHFVSALPKTRNAKVMRRVIRAAYLGEDPGDLSALENPQAVDELRVLGKE